MRRGHQRQPAHVALQGGRAGRGVQGVGGGSVCAASARACWQGAITALARQTTQALQGTSAQLSYLAGQLRHPGLALGASEAARLQEALLACASAEMAGGGRSSGWTGQPACLQGQLQPGPRRHRPPTPHSAAQSHQHRRHWHPCKPLPQKAAAPGASGLRGGKPMRTRETACEPGGAGGGTACSSTSSCRCPSFMATVGGDSVVGSAACGQERARGLVGRAPACGRHGSRPGRPGQGSREAASQHYCRKTHPCRCRRSSVTCGGTHTSLLQAPPLHPGWWMEAAGI